ncbi:hypothetical protein IWX46DRAFT_657886 [Phyllosticta citricarpa]|uniref:Delta(24)-sterol reductase n=1 Tax=Phyllosticta citricarpa TaxID=55181 RepID=A0ABR1MCV2_9PEZI
MEQHQEAVKRVAERVKSFHERQVPFRVYHGSTNSTRHVGYDAEKVVDTSALSHVISIDSTACTAIVEPNVPMDKLVAATLAQGFVPQVVPEFPGITVGGSFSGTAAESSSFKYGYFDRSVNWVEMVLATGRVVTASPHENADLFYGAVGACGTLGVTTLFEIKLIPAAKYVQVTYVPVYSTKAALQEIDRRTKEPWDYIDGILYSATLGVIVLGRITDGQAALQEGVAVRRFARARDPWYYMHCHSQVAHQRHTHCETWMFAGSRNPLEAAVDDKPATELVPMHDYFFRYDRGAFWMGSFGWPPKYFNRLTRFLTDHLFRTRQMYKAMHLSNRAQQFIVQDLALPRESAEEFLTWSYDALALFPLWLCPVDAKTKAMLHKAKGQITINVGLWGTNQSYPVVRKNMEAKWKWIPQLFQQTVADNRAIEAKVYQLGGLKWLYAHNYYTEDEFWNVYDKQRYSQLRAKWDAGTLPTLWDKMKNTQTYQKDGNFAKAAFMTFFGREHLLKKKKAK